jgi:hypothetical protein
MASAAASQAEVPREVAVADGRLPKEHEATWSFSKQGVGHGWSWGVSRAYLDLWFGDSCVFMFDWVELVWMTWRGCSLGGLLAVGDSGW